MANRWKNDLKDKDVTPEALWLNRRALIAGAGAGLGLAAMPAGARAEELKPNAYEDITSYCNYYEFGTGKGDPSQYAHMLTTKPWSV